MLYQAPILRTRAECAIWAAEQKALGVRVIFTNGVCDLPHVGHFQCLDLCKRSGENWVAPGDPCKDPHTAVLILALNGDESTHRLNKGAGRPIIPLEQRMQVFSYHRSVDAVTFFDEDTPLELLQVLKPDLIFKGDDYNPATMVGAGLAPTFTVPRVPGVSTGMIIEQIQALKKSCC